MKVTPFETYQSYLSMKNHFTNRKYDFFRYGGKSSATVTSFNKRKDKYWFEKTSRKYSDDEIVNFLLANFVTTDNPKNLFYIIGCPFLHSNTFSKFWFSRS